MINIAILYICTGKYSVFWDDFYRSSENFFLNGLEKHYFVFSDSEDFPVQKDITVIPSECRGFPSDSLFRFEMFLTIKDKLLSYDYVFFFNSNMLFVKNVNFDFLPSEDISKSGLLGVIHPGHCNHNARLFPYERNRASLAYIKKKNRSYKYFMGGLNGGRTSEYLKLIETCSMNIKKDFENGIIAVFHDESHINKYFSEQADLYVLDPSYGLPEGSTLPFEAKIIIRDKTKVSTYFDKHIGESFIGKMIRYSKIIYNAITW